MDTCIRKNLQGTHRLKYHKWSTKFSSTCSLLHGRAATTFTQALQGKTETNNSYKEVLSAVSCSIFPSCAAQTQKRYMLKDKHELNVLIADKVSEVLAARKKKRKAAHT